MIREDEKPPRRPASEDDDTVGLPDLDGGVGGPGRGEDERGFDTPIEVDVADDTESSLDDTAAGEMEAPEEEEADQGDGGADWSDGEDEPVDADPSLADGDETGWTEGSETGESDPWGHEHDGDEDPEKREIGLDRGEEGLEDPAHGTAVDDAFAAPTHDADLEGDSDDLDVQEDGAIDATGHDASVVDLPRAEVSTRWLGPPGEATRTVAHTTKGVFVAAGSLFEVRDDALVRVQRMEIAHEGDVTSIAGHGEEIVVATDAGEVLLISRVPGSDALAHRALPRPGTRDGSVGAIDAVALDTAIIVRTRGGALFRANVDETSWIGPVVARPVRMIRGSLGRGDASEWLLVLVGAGEAGSNELLATIDGRRFERVPLPTPERGGQIVGMSRRGKIVALAVSDGAVMISRDAGATWVPSPSLRDAQQVWLTHERGDVFLYAALFHEASDRGQLVRQAIDGEAHIVLDVALESRSRGLGGPGDPDGDGRIHELAVDSSDERTVLWIATGVGLFRVEPPR